MTKIRLLIDEDVSKGPQLAAALRRRGFDAMAVQEVGRMGLSDDELLNYAVAEGRALAGQWSCPAEAEWAGPGARAGRAMWPPSC